MRGIASVVVGLWVATGIAAAQSASVSVQYDGSSSHAEFDGVTITHRTAEASVPSARRQTRARVAEIDFGRTAVKVEEGYPYIEFSCKSGIRCWSDVLNYAGLGVPEPSRDHRVTCPTVQACHAFLNRLRGNTDVPGTTYQRGTPRPQPPAPPETVIDGSKIPSRIDFPGTRAASAADTPAAVPPPPPAPLPPPPPVQGIPLRDLLPPQPQPAAAPPSSVSSIGALLRQPSRDADANTPQPQGTSLSAWLDKQDTKLSRWLDKQASCFSTWIEKEANDALTWVSDQAPKVFDAATKTPLAPHLRYVANWIFDQQQKLAREFTSRGLTGKSFADMPPADQAEYLVWERGVNRILSPSSLEGGFEFVKRFGNLLDLGNSSNDK